VAIVVAWLGVDTSVADVDYDWLVARAAINGNSYDPVLSLADDEGVNIYVVRAADGSTDVVHPRTPGALFLLLPLVLVPFRYVVPLITGFSAFVLICFASSWLSSSGPPWHRRVIWLGLGLLTAPVLMSFAYAAQTLLVAAMVVGALVAAHRGKRAVPAVLAACAIVLKLYPAALLAVWWARGQKDVVFRTVIAVLGLTLLGLLLPGVSLVDSWDALRSAGWDFIRVPTNGSLAALLVNAGLSAQAASAIGIVALALLAAYVVVSGIGLSIPAVLALVVCLLLQPISWAAFDVVLVPFLVVALADSPTSRLSDAGPLVLWLILTVGWLASASFITELTFLARVALLVVLLIPRSPPPRPVPGSDLSEILVSEIVA